MPIKGKDFGLQSIASLGNHCVQKALQESFSKNRIMGAVHASTNLLLTKLSPRWINYYEKFFSAPILPSLLLILSIFWIAKSSAAEFYKSAGLFLPILAIMLISIVFESGENMRFKFFIEPILWIFISTQVYLILMSIKKYISHIQK